MVKMPVRKEPKETVVYAASKRKALPFKPQRPSKVPRVATSESETSTAPTASRPPTSITRGPSISTATTARFEREADEEDEDDSDEGLAADPLAPRPRESTKSRPQPQQRQAVRRPSPPGHISEDEDDDLSPAPRAANRGGAADGDVVPLPSQNDSPAIPQPLLVRLLHEHFSDKSTKIDKHAIQVVQKYLEVFVREAIARTALQKKQDAVSELDVGWLELEDLEKVAAGMVLDF